MIAVAVVYAAYYYSWSKADSDTAKVLVSSDKTVSILPAIVVDLYAWYVVGAIMGAF